MKISKRVVLCSFIALLVSFPGQAKATDVIVLKNGDRISGEITRIWDDEITIEPEYSDDFNVGVRAEEIGDVSETSSVATWVLRYSQDFFSDDFTLFHNHSIIPTISGRTNTSYRTSTGIRYEITDLLYANISLDYDYETVPVDDTTRNENLVLLFGLGPEF